MSGVRHCVLALDAVRGMEVLGDGWCEWRVLHEGRGRYLMSEAVTATVTMVTPRVFATRTPGADM